MRSLIALTAACALTVTVFYALLRSAPPTKPDFNKCPLCEQKVDK
jgi:hypothetical protein